MIKKYAQNDLKALSDLLKELQDRDYTKSIDLLSGATVGQHIRHILEFYFAIISNLENGKVCYDKRKREQKIENNRVFVINKIEETLNKLMEIESDRELILISSYDADSFTEVEMKTSLYRELGYCVEHSIHHQALIKIGIQTLNLNISLSKEFGVAPATVKYRKDLECAQ